MPKLNFGKKEEEPTRAGREAEKSKREKDRQLSGSNRGSIGRKERLRNALTGRSDASGDGADQPKELPESELIDFLRSYDQTDKYCFKLIEKKVEKENILNKSLGSNEGGDENIESPKNSKNESNGQSGFEGGSNDGSKEQAEASDG